MDEREFKASQLFRTLGNPLRLRIVKILAGGPATPGEIAERLERTQPNISQHMKVLRDADVVWYRPGGSRVEYDLKDPGVVRILEEAESFASKRPLGPRRKARRTRR